MPELPEVETTVRDLKKKVLGRTFVDVWTDFEKIIKRPDGFKKFKKEIVGKKIKNIRRRAKFIIFDLSEDKSLLVHQRLTGHLLVSNWENNKGKWKNDSASLSDRVNTYIHLMFWLDNGLMIALSDLRKFTKMEIFGTKEIENLDKIKKLGPEPLEKEFTLEKFKERVKDKKKKIKQVLMDQEIISGIGNIYASEILFKAEVHPFKTANDLSEKELKKIYCSIKKVLKRAVELRGESFADWRDADGKKGSFDDERNVYQKEGEKCPRCGGIIKRKKINNRSTYFCPKCQKNDLFLLRRR
jgi:formamidopyrimidine-DNA glycosylase